MKGHTKAMRILGLDKLAVDKVAKLVDVMQFSPDAVLLAYQNKCADLG